MKNKLSTKQRIKKYVVITGMFLIFCLMMWLNFKPSKTDKQEEQGVGINANLPNPTEKIIIGDKINAYEQEQLQQKQQGKMNTLQEFKRLLSGGEPTEIKKDTLVQRKKSPVNSVTRSAHSYRDLNRTLGTFYETPKEDKEKEALQKKIENLQKQLDEKANNRHNVDNQVALMEKSYELAARYLPKNGGYETAQPVNNSNGKVKITTVRQVNEQTVSSLSQPMGNNEFVEHYSIPRNVGFHSTADESRASNGNTIGAIVHDTQTIVEGQSVRLRLTQTILVGDICIPANTMLTGFCKVQGDRLEVIVSSIEYAGKLFAVEMDAYDTDGQKGIHIPGSMERNSLKEIAANVGGNLGSSINISHQNAGEQLLTDLGRGVIQGTSKYIAKKVSQVKVTLKSGYKLLLLPKEKH